jgi:hypothetical protein
MKGQALAFDRCHSYAAAGQAFSVGLGRSLRFEGHPFGSPQKGIALASVFETTMKIWYLILAADPTRAPEPQDLCYYAWVACRSPGVWRYDRKRL